MRACVRAHERMMDASGGQAAHEGRVWRVGKRRDFRKSMLVDSVAKKGLLKPVQKDGKMGATMYFEVSGSYLRYFKIQRRMGEMFTKRLTFFKRRPQSVQDRVARDKPEGCIDLRLVVVELAKDANKSHTFRISNAMNVEEEFLDLKAKSMIQAKSWVKTINDIRGDMERKSVRRSQRVKSVVDFSLDSDDLTQCDEKQQEAQTKRMSLLKAQEQEEEGVYADADNDDEQVEEEPLPAVSQKKRKMPITCPTICDYIEQVADYYRDDAFKFAQSRVVIDDNVVNGFSVLSFNLLANTYVENTRIENLYRHCDKDCLPWSFRERAILKHLAVVGADIICLQECEMEVFEQTGRIGGALRRAGYEGEIDCNTTKDGKVIPGRAIFYRKRIFEVAWRERSYRSLVIGLRVLAGPERGSIVACVNSHLEGALGRWKDRHSQMRGALKKVALLASQGQARFTLICGDFNDGAMSDLCQKVLGAESGMVSAYDNHPKARDVTCLLFPLDADTSDIEEHRVDHIFFDSRLVLRGVMNVMEPKWWRDGVVEQGLPSVFWPSDHLSIGAVFTFNPHSPLFAPKPPKQQEDKPDPFKLGWSVQDILDSTKQCPLSDEERQLYLEHCRFTPRKKPGKPSKESIERMRELSNAKEAFVTSLAGEEKQAFVRKLIAYERALAKKGGQKAKQKKEPKANTSTALERHVPLKSTKNPKQEQENKSTARGPPKSKKNHYQLLEIAYTASPEEIKAAWVAKSRVSHPDKGSRSSVQRLTNVQAALNEAHRILSDPQLKAKYDQEIGNYEK